jgi:hypothetical protein
MNEGVLLENGEYGRRAVITSVWSPEMAGFLTSNEVVELELNEGKGWRGDNLGFLSELTHLRALKVIDLRIPSVKPIHYLHELLALDVITYCKTEINFEAFPLLQECALEWRPKATSLFDSKSLRKLFLNRYKGKDTAVFGRLSALESLAILNAPITDLHGLSALRGLRSLRLGDLRCLTSLAGIEPLHNLEELEVHTCRRLTSIEEVGALSRLRRLHLNNDGNIDSLKPLNRLGCLEAVLFYESTNIVDGDLSPLLLQRHLSRVSFQNRRHYSHRREQFGAGHTG